MFVNNLYWSVLSVLYPNPKKINFEGRMLLQLRIKPLIKIKNVKTNTHLTKTCTFDWAFHLYNQNFSYSMALQSTYIKHRNVSSVNPTRSNQWLFVEEGSSAEKSQNNSTVTLLSSNQKDQTNLMCKSQAVVYLWQT